MDHLAISVGRVNLSGPTTKKKLFLCVSFKKKVTKKMHDFTFLLNVRDAPALEFQRDKKTYFWLR